MVVLPASGFVEGRRVEALPDFHSVFRIPHLALLPPLSPQHSALSPVFLDVIHERLLLLELQLTLGQFRECHGAENTDFRLSQTFPHIRQHGCPLSV